MDCDCDFDGGVPLIFSGIFGLEGRPGPGLRIRDRDFLLFGKRSDASLGRGGNIDGFETRFGT